MDLSNGMTLLTLRNIFVLLTLTWLLCDAQQQMQPADVDDRNSPTNTLFIVEGRVSIPETIAPEYWQRDTKILLSYGSYVGFVQKDGSFKVSVPSGSYIMEVANKDFIFEPVRVDVSSRGKVRARRLQLLQPSAVNTMPYPVRFKPKSAAKYFQARETWRITDFLFSPMVIMMALPLLLVLVLPKLIDTSDPQLQRDMQQSLQMPKYELPELSEVMATWFGGAKKPKTKANKKK